MAIIKKKTWQPYFDYILEGKKNYEFRLADFDIKEGDTLILEEWDPETKSYTGRSIEKVVSYVSTFREEDLTKWWTVEEMQEYGFHIMSLKNPDREL